ncbi:hypothetical protein ACLMJK_002439 [Lecanora helva]
MPRRPKPSGNNFPEISGEPPFEFIIAERGDILLEIRDKTSGQDYCFRCSRNVLSSASGYFDVLFDPAKFSEGIAIHKELQALYKQHDGPIPASKLPRVSVADLGELPNGGSLPPILAVTTFLKILQDPNTTWPVDRFQSLNLVALLAIIADRFDAPKRVAIYLRTQALDVTLLKTKRPTTPSAIELENRQRLLSGIIFGFPQWVLQSSSALIVEGSMRWKVKHYDHETESDKDIDGALWWRLPSGIEADELYCRREYVLETLASIQKHFINLYSSRQPQCKLGYDSSPRCDSYQLGEIIRFFTRKGLLRIESAFAPTPDEGLDPYVGSVDDVIGRLRESLWVANKAVAHTGHNLASQSSMDLFGLLERR